ncbi:DinB family protein [candidate division KSB1 bacterium]|nr:DinB family protein [candidate division KSB1 bacterium]
MFEKIADFEKEWQSESATTLKMMRALTDASLKQKVTSEGRSLGRMAWHIVLTLGEMGTKAGLPVESPPEDAPVPSTAQEIIDVYEKAARSLLSKVKELWTDRTLTEVIELYGESWTRGFTLYVLIKHEIRHRAQMTVLMSQAGLGVPGVYGPSKEEWAAYGAPAAE